MDRTDVNILVVMAYYSFTKCYYWVNVGKMYKGSLCIISYNCMRIYNYLNF